VHDETSKRGREAEAENGGPTAADAPRRAHFQQLADMVSGHAAARGWPQVTYQAAYINIASRGAEKRLLEGNSIYWNTAWDSDADCNDHPVSVRSGQTAWSDFLVAAFYPDLLSADAELRKHKVASAGSAATEPPSSPPVG